MREKNKSSILVCTFIFLFGIMDENTVWKATIMAYFKFHNKTGRKGIETKWKK